MNSQAAVDYIRQSKQNRKDNYEAYFNERVDIEKYLQFSDVSVPMLALVRERKTGTRW